MTNYDDTPVLWTPGSKITSAMVADLQNLQNALTDGFSDFTSSLAWTGSTTNPSLGNGQKAAEYKQIGKVVDYRGLLVAGSTTTFGSGKFQINLPVTPDSRANSMAAVEGGAIIYDSSADTTYIAALVSISTSLFRIVSNASTGATSASPMAWTTNDRVAWWLRYLAP